MLSPQTPRGWAGHMAGGSQEPAPLELPKAELLHCLAWLSRAGHRAELLMGNTSRQCWLPSSIVPAWAKAAAGDAPALVCLWAWCGEDIPCSTQQFVCSEGLSSSSCYICQLPLAGVSVDLPSFARKWSTLGWFLFVSFIFLFSLRREQELGCV